MDAPGTSTELLLRPKAAWRYGFTAFVVFALGGVVGQQEWESLPGVLLFAVLAAYTWWARVEVQGSRILVRRLHSWVLPLNRSTTAERAFTVGRVPYRVLEIRTGTAVLRMLFIWWDNWRDLAGLLTQRGYGDLEFYTRP